MVYTYSEGFGTEGKFPPCECICTSITVTCNYGQLDQIKNGMLNNKEDLTNSLNGTDVIELRFAVNVEHSGKNLTVKAGWAFLRLYDDERKEHSVRR